MIKFISIGCIKLYQKFISPKKGYSCAHRIKNGGTGCSGAVIKIIEENSIFQWKSLISERFSDCKKAATELSKDKNKKSKCKKCKNKIDCDPCDACDIFDSCDIF